MGECDGRIALITGASRGIGRAIALGYVNSSPGVSADWVRAGHYEIEVACERFAAKPSLRPLYDPRGERVRA